jgi:hypothetical protein
LFVVDNVVLGVHGALYPGVPIVVLISVNTYSTSPDAVDVIDGVVALVPVPVPSELTLSNEKAQDALGVKST